ncbi:hypothetical protein D3C75_1263650 [compost metagenome]
MSGFGEGHSPRAAIEQAGLQAFFEAYDLSTDMGRRNPEAFGGCGELAALSDGHELVDTFPAVVGHLDYPCMAIMFCF